MLDPIPAQSADLYAAAVARMVSGVNREMAAHPGIQELIGHNPLQMMEIHHLDHTHFMMTAFRLHAFDLLVRIVPLFYRIYHSRGFSYEYFPIAFQYWKKALSDNIADNDSRQIAAVYDWMISRHETLIELSLSGEPLGFSLPDKPDTIQLNFNTLLLHSDLKGCLELAEQIVTTHEELLYFYEHVVKPALYTVGALWERNEMSVAEEHFAAAIVGRIMSFLYCRFIGTLQTKGTVIVSVVPNEFHEIGARMVADILEFEGWDVTYLGTNTPLEELVKLIKRKQPFLLALSVTTALNLEKVRSVIAKVKSMPEISSTKILVGGQAFCSVPRLWREFGADGYAADLVEATAQCDAWWEAKVHP